MAGKDAWLEAIVAVAGGRGFVVQTDGTRYVVTAGHCLPELPPCAAFATSAERTYPTLLGLPGRDPTTPAECVFVDPVADLAVLGPPDARSLPRESKAFRALVDAAEPLPIGGLACGGLTDKVPDETIMPGEGQADSDAWLLSLDGRWFACTVKRQGRGLWIANAVEAIRGGSGSPIVTPDGTAIGVLCTASSADGYRSGGPNPELAARLPGWMLRDVRRL